MLTGNKGNALDMEKINIREYVKYLLKEGSVVEKRELLANLRSRILYRDRKIELAELKVAFLNIQSIQYDGWTELKKKNL